MSSQVTISTAPGRKRARSSSAPRRVARKSGKKFASKLWNAKIGRGIPHTMSATLRYCEVNTVSVTTGSSTNLSFKCNGLFDPDDALGGHQSYLYDQLTPLYDHWTVKASRVKITFGNTAASDRWVVIGFIDDDATSTSNVNTALEKEGGKNKFKLLPPAASSEYLKLNWSLPKNFDIKNGMGLERFQGTTATDPTELSHYYFLIQNRSGATATLDYVAEIEYDVEFVEPKEVAGS